MSTESEMKKAVRHLETTARIKELLPGFFARPTEETDRPVAWCMVGVPPELLKAFDLEWEWPENFGTLCASNLVAPKFIELAEGEGYSSDICSYVNNTMGYCKRYLEEKGAPPELGKVRGMRKPSFLLGSGVTCEPRYKWFQTVATRYFQVPIHSTDPLAPPWDQDATDLRIEKHYLEQLRRDLHGQVDFLEKQTGQKLDMERLKKIMEYSQEALWYWYQVLQLRKAVPSPMGSTDYFMAIIPQMYMLGELEAVNFYRQMYNEVKDRVEKGISVTNKEKYRLIWFGLPPWFNLGMFNYLESVGAVVVYESIYNMGEWVELDLSDPLEALVERTWKKAVDANERGAETRPETCELSAVGNFTGSNLLEELVEDFKLDGAILHQTRSCRALSFGHIHTKNRLARLDIPSLVFESDMADPRLWSDAQVKTRIHAFLEMMDK
ncbi:MAG: 2-hydroxyacyl-CoA dehydratase family protein [Bacillota bacterium]|nr:2-hydroxyacyl-CoA dehydratase family protein [Bacillota bacterium]